MVELEWRRRGCNSNCNEKVVVNVEAKTREKGGGTATEDAKGKPGTATCLR